MTQYQVDAKGRTTEETDPDGNVTYAVYLDAQQEVRVYPGWDSTTDTTTGPTQVSINDPAGGFSETLTMTATPRVTDGAPDGSEAISDVQSLTVDVTNAAGQVIAEDDYFNLAGLTFAPGVIGTLGVNYYQTLFGYDAVGNLVARANAQRARSTAWCTTAWAHVLSTWVGTNDTPASGEWSPTNNDRHGEHGADQRQRLRQRRGGRRPADAADRRRRQRDDEHVQFRRPAAQRDDARPRRQRDQHDELHVRQPGQRADGDGRRRQRGELHV